MRSIRIFTFAAVMSFALMFALISQQQTGVEAGKKKMLKNAVMAALLLHGGKKILFPLPIPLPIPVLKQTQPIYYEQPSYHSYGGGHQQHY